MSAKTTVKTYENTITVPKFNLMSLDEAEITNKIDYLLFVDHEEDMTHYTHLRSLIQDLVKLTIGVADLAVAEFQNDMSRKITDALREDIEIRIANAVYDAKIGTNEVGVVRTTIDETHIIDQTFTREEAHRDW